MKNEITKDGKGLLVLMFLIGLVAISDPAFAATCDPTTPVFCNPLNLSGTGINTIGDALVVIIKFLLSVIGLISMFFIVVAGIKYIISNGNEESLKSAKNTMTAAVTGLAIALISYGIVTALENILQVV